MSYQEMEKSAGNLLSW